MADRTAEDIVQVMLGRQAIQIATLQAEVEKLTRELADAKKASSETPAVTGDAGPAEVH
jgi:hypothetical protein